MMVAGIGQVVQWRTCVLEPLCRQIFETIGCQDNSGGALPNVAMIRNNNGGVVVAKTCTGLPTINGVMENITANLGDKVGQPVIRIQTDSGVKKYSHWDH